ncbi:hypothetical protein [Mycobacteroides abscessus]|uniref:hypothetical protein n=1 Tax=Mycobacteroides abscessus TaxID=36809 RepID=UPI0013F69A25|nr:hypothetical protein [Mycobacteroides abscessus]
MFLGLIDPRGILGCQVRFKLRSTDAYPKHRRMRLRGKIPGPKRAITLFHQALDIGGVGMEVHRERMLLARCFVNVDGGFGELQIDILTLAVQIFVAATDHLHQRAERAADHHRGHHGVAHEHHRVGLTAHDDEHQDQKENHERAAGQSQDDLHRTGLALFFPLERRGDHNVTGSRRNQRQFARGVFDSAHSR